MRHELGLKGLRFFAPPLPATWAKKEDKANGEKIEGSKIGLVGYLNSPSGHRRGGRTLANGASGGGRRHIYGKNM